MRNLIVLLLLALVPATFTSCRHGRTGPMGPAGENGQDGQDGQDGRDGIDGIDGRDGLSGIGFDYVRGMDGARVCNAALIVPAQHVLPDGILNFAPAEDPYDPDGLTLTFGTEELAFRIYLGMIMQGEYCVIEKEWGEGWDAVESENNPLVFAENGWVAVVPLDTLNLFDTSFLALLLDVGVLVEFGPNEVETEEGTVLEDVCLTLDYSRNRLKIGRKVRINFNRD